MLGGLLFAWLPLQAWVKSADAVAKPQAALPAQWARALASAAPPQRGGAGRDAARVALKERPAQRLFQVAQAMPAEQPTLRLVWRAAVEVAERSSLDLSPGGERFLVPIVGGADDRWHPQPRCHRWHRCHRGRGRGPGAAAAERTRDAHAGAVEQRIPAAATGRSGRAADASAAGLGPADASHPRRGVRQRLRRHAPGARGAHR